MNIEIKQEIVEELQRFCKQINILKKEYENLQEITSDKDTQILSLSSQTQFYQTQLKGLKQEVEKRKGPLQRLMRGDFLSGSKLNKNLYDE